MEQRCRFKEKLQKLPGRGAKSSTSAQGRWQDVITRCKFCRGETLPAVALFWCQALGITRLITDSGRNAEAALTHPEVCKASIGHGNTGSAFITASEPPLRVLDVPQGTVTSRPSFLGVLGLGGDTSAPAPACSQDANRKVYEDRRQGDI